MNTSKNLDAVVRVFVNHEGKFGNSTGLVLDENNQLSDEQRRQIAFSSGFSECVFIHNKTHDLVSVYNPQNEIAFSGYALLGAAHFLAHVLKTNSTSMKTKAGNVSFRIENETPWISSSLQDTPPWNHVELADVSAIENLSVRTQVEHTLYWAWLDKSSGVVRARTFAPDWGIPEDEANGSGSMQLAHHLNQPLEIHHGKGSIILTRPVTADVVELGGTVSLD